MRRKDTVMDTTKLWYYALNGSPLVQAIALTLLDKILDGAISRLGREIPNAKSGKRF